MIDQRDMSRRRMNRTHSMWTEDVLRECNILHTLAERADIQGCVLRFDVRPTPYTGLGVERIRDGRASC